MQTTICALATGTGGAVALVRLSGPMAFSILNQVTRTGKKWEPRRQSYCTIYDGEEILDKALITCFPGPNSFTGEDVVEFALHGSSYIKGRLLEVLCLLGAEPAKRGEFSQRAFMNGKMDLLEAQGLCDLISAGNKASHKLAMDSLGGKLSARVESLKEGLSELLAQIEVRLDDVEEEMSPLSHDFIQSKITDSLVHIKALADTFSVGKFIKDGLKVAIVGSPNSGKSSLLNALVGFDRAIVADACGTTRDTVEEIMEINGQKIILTDTAGIRDHALDPAEQEGMRRSIRAMEKADFVLFVLDSSRPMTEQEKKLWADIQTQEKRILVVLNKRDLLAEDLAVEAFSSYPVLSVSCKTGEGLDALKTALTADVEAVQAADGLIISNLRHFEALLRAQTELETALIRLQVQAGGEILAEHLRGSLQYLKDLIGEITPDDVLGIIFSKFCMGK